MKPIVTSPRSLKLKASASKRYEGALYELSVYHKLAPISYATEAAEALSYERDVKVISFLFVLGLINMLRNAAEVLGVYAYYVS